MRYINQLKFQNLAYYKMLTHYIHFIVEVFDAWLRTFCTHYSKT